MNAQELVVIYFLVNIQQRVVAGRGERGCLLHMHRILMH